MALYPKLITDALSKVRYPGNGKDLVSAGMVEDDIRIDGNKVSFSLIFEKPNDPFIKSVVKAAETAILTYVGEDVDIKGNINIKSLPPICSTYGRASSTSNILGTDGPNISASRP